MLIIDVITLIYYRFIYYLFIIDFKNISQAIIVREIDLKKAALLKTETAVTFKPRHKTGKLIKAAILFLAIADLPRITFATTPPLLRMGQKVSLNCSASGLSTVDVTWYRGSDVLASSNSVVVVTLTNITGQDWGEFLCVANNSVGEDRKSVFLKSK